MVQKMYLSKSKAANPELVMSVKKAIKEHSIDIQILAFEGGSYDPNLKYTADMGITIGPSPVHITEDGIKVVFLGRGGFDETKLLQEAGKRVGIVLYEKEQDPLEWKNLKIGIPIVYTETKENYQVNWGYITIDYETSFDDFISNKQTTKEEVKNQNIDNFFL
jgi:hypothetical protein